MAARMAEIPPATEHKACQGHGQCEDVGDSTAGGQVSWHMG